VGVSLGGMVGQHLAFEHPARVRSLTAIMTTPGPRRFLPRPYALRAMTYFPHRFAGLILRHPDADAVADLRLGSLNGKPVLLLSSPATATACAKLKERIDALTKDSCTVIETTDAYPFKAATPEIEKWLAGVKRDLMLTHVVLEPNHDQWHDGFWVRIGTMDSLETAPRDKMPRLEVDADLGAKAINGSVRRFRHSSAFGSANGGCVIIAASIRSSTSIWYNSAAMPR